jgi:hypothetical protein
MSTPVRKQTTRGRWFRKPRRLERWLSHEDDGVTETEERYAGYEVHDRNGMKIGKMDDLFVDENDRTEYLSVKMSLFGLRSTLIPRGDGVDQRGTKA